MRVSLADKLHNALAMWADWERDGIETFNVFNADIGNQRWYFGALRDVYAERHADSSLFPRFSKLVEKIQDEWKQHE